MAWPDDYIDRAQWAKPKLEQQVKAHLKNLLAPKVLTDEETQDLTERVVLEAFDRAFEHWNHPEYFPDEDPDKGKDPFFLWLKLVALRELLHRLLRHAGVEPCLHALSPEQGRLLGMVYVDRLPYGDVAPVLRMSPEEARKRCADALTALFQALRQS